MKGLFIKDFKLIASQKKLFLMAILVATIFVWTSDDVTFAATYIILLLSMLTLTTLSYDDMSGGMLFLLSLPTDRKSYVKEKYVFALFNLILATAVSFVVCYGFAIVKGTNIKLDALISNIMGIMLGMGLMLAVTIPLELKYGAEKGRIAMIASIAIVVIIGVGGYKLLTEVLNVDVNAVLVKILARLPKTEIFIVGGLFVVLLVVLFISYMISNRIINKKEF